MGRYACYTDVMVHDALRNARVDHNLSRGELSRLSGVPRERIRQIENGANFTIETLQKLLPHLPGLKTIALGSSELKVGGVDAAELRDELAQWLEAGRHLLGQLERVVVVTAEEAGPDMPRELEERLRRLEAAFPHITAGRAEHPSRGPSPAGGGQSADLSKA
jgi:transcriptional regulator with XRE-family HTH domain